MSKKEEIKRLSSPERKDFEGEKVTMKSLVDCDIIIHDFILMRNQFKEKDSDSDYTMLAQIEKDNVKCKVFITNPFLMELIQQAADKGDLPSLVTVREAKGTGKFSYHYFE